MDESRYIPAFQIIMSAGNSRSAAMLAIEAARKFDFLLATQHLELAEQEMRKAHELQIDMVRQEASGEGVDLNIILVHAQDHLTMAMMAKDHAAEFVTVYQMIRELKGEQR